MKKFLKFWNLFQNRLRNKSIRITLRPEPAGEGLSVNF